MDKETKLSLLSDMIALARSSEGIKDIELNFLIAVAAQMGISESEVHRLTRSNPKKIIIQSETERILHFHRLVLMMNIDQLTDNREILTVKNFGLKMGLNQEAIDKVLIIMNEYPDRVVPPDVLIDLFKAQHN